MNKFIKEIIPYIIIIIVVLFIRTFVVTPVRVDGVSMEKTLKDNDILILNKLDKNYDRFDVVVFNYNNEKLIKRIIGLPGESVNYKNGKLYIDNKEVKDDLSNTTGDFKLINLGHTIIPDDKYFLLGDNRNHSLDSRLIGLVDKSSIEGTVSLRIFPFTKISFVK